jgi:hypothetical protein
MGLAVLLATACARAQQQEPLRVEPVSGAFTNLPPAPPPAGTTPGARLDRVHDWLYIRLQRFLGDFDTQFSGPGNAPLVVPLSPLRIGLDAQLLHGAHGSLGTVRPDFEATVRLPNLERRFRIFISSSDLPESASNTALDRNPVRAGLRFAAIAHVDLDLGVRVKLKPSAYVALRWAHDFEAHGLHYYPFAKPYAESGLGVGASGGLALERWQGLWVVRSASYANWLRNAAATDWSQTLLLGHAQAVISEGRYDRLSAGHDLACGTALHATVVGDRLTRATSYELALTYKRPLRGGWLYGYVEPVVRWERAGNWHPDAGARVGVDALFWGLAAPAAGLASHCR